MLSRDQLWRSRNRCLPLCCRSSWIAFIALLVCGIACSNKSETRRANEKSAIDAEANLKRQAETMLDAYANNRSEKFSQFVIPEILENAGGRDAMVRIVDQMVADLNQRGFRILKCRINESPVLQKTTDGMFGVLRYELRMSAPGDRIGTQNCALLCVSRDSGKSWKFAEVRENYREKFKRIIPGFPDSLKIPIVKKMAWTKTPPK